MPRTATDLRDTLNEIDRSGYKAYKRIAGRWTFADFEISIDHVQGDPFASPSAVSAEISLADTHLPAWALIDQPAIIATRDYLARVFDRTARRIARGHRGSGRGGIIEIDTPGQEILERSAVVIRGQSLTIRFFIGLPAHGRRVSGRDAVDMLMREVPQILTQTLFYSSETHPGLEEHVHAMQDAAVLRHTLTSNSWVAFVADGALLPRAAGVDPRPMKGDDAVRFQSPESLRQSVDLPNRGTITGMAIPPGVTLVCGGGYHGKSTLLDAISAGIYDHLPGDGRELVVSSDRAVKIRAEDGRRVERVSIDPFINNLPHGRDTRAFSSQDASGSTSQAANIVEALETGADLLLIDEDTSATNFMIRDHRMQELINKDQEPITPFIDKVRQLSDEWNVSTILVVGGSGDYFDVADRVIAMREYVPYDVSQRAREIADRHRSERQREGGARFGSIRHRIPIADSIDPSKGKKSVKTRSRGVDEISFGTDAIDLSAVEQLVDQSQLNSIAEALIRIRKETDGSATVSQILNRLFGNSPKPRLLADNSGRLAAVRPMEVAAALNRLPTLQVRQRP